MDPMLNSRQVRAKCGEVTDMTIWRWLREAEFPAPTKVNRRNFWRESEIDNWWTTRTRAA